MRLGGAALIALTLICPLAARPAARPAPPPHGAARPAAHGLPDTILAQVGTRRRISISGFRHAWAQLEPPARPDSLTPQAAREFLRLLIGKEALAEAALRETWSWTHAESAKFDGLRDRLTLRAALEGPLAEARGELASAGTPDADEAQAGQVARDSAVARLHPVYDEARLERLARAFRALPRPARDSGLFAQLRVLALVPVVGAADSLGVVVRSDDGGFRGCDLQAWWRTLNPLARPRIETVEQTRDLVRNAVFERRLRAAAARLGLERRPDIAAELDRQRELLAVTHYVDREVYATLVADSLTLLREYRRDPGVYTIPARVRCLKLALPTRADAGRMALRLRDRAEAESLMALAARQRLGYVVEVSAFTDSLLFARATRAGPDDVVGPDSVGGDWVVARVIALLPPQPRSFAEARTLVEHQWYGDEGERRMAALVERLRRGARVVENEAALARLTAP